MKLKTKIIAGAAALSFLTFAADSLRAQETNVITFTATASVQANSSDNGTVTTTPVPIKASVDTKQILTALAVDENAAGNWASNKFPTGAILVVVSSEGGPDFQVLSKTKTLLVDVTNIITASNTGNFGSDIFSGKQNDNTGLADTSETDLQIFTVSFDDTAIVGGEDTQFYLTGLITNTTTDTVPNAITHVYKETESHTMSTAAGDGNYQGHPVVITGGFTAASASATLTL
jgi:hypothetical protein